MQKITPCLWFDGKAEEAMNFYTAIFKDSRVTSVMRHGDAGPQGRRDRFWQRLSTSTDRSSSP